MDGSFVSGAAVAATMILFGYHPAIATAVALVIGFLAGCVTGLLHTKGKINALLAGILMMIALYSINLRIMGLTSENSIGRPNIPLLNAETLFSKFQAFLAPLGIDNVQSINFLVCLVSAICLLLGQLLFIMAIIVLLIKFIVDWFLKTEVGLAIRATGDNKKMIRSLSANTDTLVIIGLGFSNALVAFSGALFAQYAKYADISMGIGMIVIGLASVIIGEAIFGTKTIVRTTLAVIAGAIIYRIVLALALRVDFLDTGDMKLITAVIVICAWFYRSILKRGVRKREKRSVMRNVRRRNYSLTKEGNAIVEARTDK